MIGFGVELVVLTESEVFLIGWWKEKQREFEILDFFEWVYWF